MAKKSRLPGPKMMSSKEVQGQLAERADAMQAASVTSVPTLSLEHAVQLRGALVSRCWRSWEMLVDARDTSLCFK